MSYFLSAKLTVWNIPIRSGHSFLRVFWSNMILQKSSLENGMKSVPPCFQVRAKRFLRIRTFTIGTPRAVLVHFRYTV